MIRFWLISSVIFIAQLNNPEPEFLQLKTQLESYGFEVNLAIPPEFNLPKSRNGFRQNVRKPYGMLHLKSKSIWINPIVFELGISKPTLIHEAVHAAQYCAGNGNIQKLGIELEPIPQARPFFKRYLDTQRQDLEREAYTIQTQLNSYQLARSLLEKHCQSNIPSN